MEISRLLVDVKKEAVMDPEVPTQVSPSEETPAETPAAESPPVEQTPAESEPGTPTGEPQKPAEAPVEPKQEPKAEVKPTSRRSAAYRIQQLVNENNELKKQVAPKTEATAEEGDPPAGTTPDPKYAKLEAEIEALKGLVKPVMTSTQKAADDAELSELFTGKAEEKAKYEDKIRNLWNESQYKDLAASDLYKIATYDEAIANAKAQAIEEYKKAEIEAKEDSASGSNSAKNRAGKTEKTAWDMTEEEFKAVTDKARSSG